MGPVAKWLPDRTRLHLQHGPSDLIVYAEGARDCAYEAAVERFQTVIKELSNELDALRLPVKPKSPNLEGLIARRMVHAANCFSGFGFITPMAAVAGAIADEILKVMKHSAPLKRAYVNNGGDIALFLTKGSSFETLIAGVRGEVFGRVRLSHVDGIRGIATSGRHGRSLSLGIADSVTVLAKSAAQADAAATMVANAVDLPDHPAITRCRAKDVKDDTDLENFPVVTSCEDLSEKDKMCALNYGLVRAELFRRSGFIKAASLHLQGAAISTARAKDFLSQEEHFQV